MADITLLAEAASCLSDAVQAPALDLEDSLDKLKKALVLINRADEVFGPTQPRSLESMLLRGFQSLASYVLQDGEEANDLKRAEAHFNAALKDSSSSPRARFGKAVLSAHRGDWQTALKSFREVLMRAAPHKPTDGVQVVALRHLRFAMASCFVGLGRIEKAQKALLGVIELHPDPEALCALSRLATRDSDTREAKASAMTYTSKAMQVAPKHPVVLLQAADHAFKVGHAKQTNGEPPPEWALAKSFLEEAAEGVCSKQVRAELHYQQGRLAHVKGDVAKAMREYEQSVDLMPQHQIAVYTLAQCLVHRKLYSRAMKLLEKSPKHMRQEPEVLKLLITAYLATNDNEHNHKAREASDRLVALVPEDVEALSMKAEAYTRVKPKDAVSTYERLAQLLESPENQSEAMPEMWNNMGTIFSIYGDPAMAQRAYEKGLEFVEQQILHSTDPQEKKELEVSQICLKFNRAFLAESHPSGPEIAEAVSEYITMQEDNPWFADASLRVGKQWQSLGRTQQALQSYRMAMNDAPFEARLYSAEALREAGQYTNALKWGERALAAAGEKEEHYAYVFLANLYYEAATSHKTPSAAKDEYLRMAMERYVKALDIDSDCFAAANGVGMVFARRGKPEIARKAFQCVRDHKAMEDNPSIYINLAHTYIQTHGVRRRKRVFGDDAESEPETEERIANTRKAISLYQKAKELDPDDVSVNLHIAKALNNLKDYDEAAAVLSEAAHNWPFDMLVKINQAKNWEDWAKHTLRVYRGFRAIQKPGCLEKVEDARDCLTSAVAAWNFISNYWSEMTHIECGLLSRRSGHPEGLKTFMSNIKEHIANLQQLIETVNVRVQELARQIHHNDLQLERLNLEKKEGEREAENRAKNSEAFRREKHLEAEDQALRLMESGRHIRLGRNLEAVKDKAAAKSSNKKKKTEEKQETPQEAEQPMQVVEGGEDIGGDAANTISGIFDDEIPHDDEEVVVPREREKKDKKKKKDKKDKKDKEKKDKKDKKRKHRENEDTASG